MPIEKILKKIFTITITFSTLISLHAHAKSNIDPVTQIYTLNETEIFADLRFKRSYSSRSVFRGHFGAGWCSELDGRVLTYDGGELRYRGCDVDSALLLEARESAISIRRTATGFLRLREDGATQVFNHDGYLLRVERSDGEFRILRDLKNTPIELVVRTAIQARKFRIETSVPTGEVDSISIHAIGAKSRFGYSGQMLTAWTEENRTSRYAYDRQLNMTNYTADFSASGTREIIEYDDLTDRAVRFERSSAFERERLLVTMQVNEKLDTIEMKIGIERGAEMHPVSISYNLKTRHISLEGSRDVARLLLSLMRT